MLRVVYFGTPPFAVPTLAALAADPRFEVRLVVTQPDRPAGRGRKLDTPAVAIEAARLGLPLFQTATLRTAADRVPLVEADADLFVVAAFGLIFGKVTLGLPRLGCLNLHGSVLPKYRGASPVQAAILEGDDRTGVTLMRMDAGLDTGDMIAVQNHDILSADTAESLTARLAGVAAELATAEIPEFASGMASSVPQPDSGASVTRPVTRADGWLDWSAPADHLERRVRAMWPWPRAWTSLDGGPLQIHAATVIRHEITDDAGTARLIDGRLVVACGDGSLQLDRVQPAGGRPMDGAAFAAGRRSFPAVLGTQGRPEPGPPLVRRLGSAGKDDLATTT
jgi:methionyl-tRNA formyltransferase